MCVYCGEFSSAVACWPCTHLKQQVAEACAAKDAEIAKLKESFLQSQDARQGWLREFDGYKKTILLQQQRLSEATFIIERIGTTEAERPEVIRAAENWLKSKPS